MAYEIAAYQRLLGDDYHPHGGPAALRREAAFHDWCARGLSPDEFAAHVAEAERLHDEAAGQLMRREA
jgi:hypothetical protein